MQEPVEYEYGDTTYEVPQYDDGRFDCPLCPRKHIYEELSHLGLHLSKGHNLQHKTTTDCPECGEEFTYENNNSRTYCSSSCATTATNKQRAQS